MEGENRVTMHDAPRYREQAARARRLAEMAHQRDLIEILRQVAQDYDKLAEDLEKVRSVPQGKSQAEQTG
jgi:hypothetical protein